MEGGGAVVGHCGRDVVWEEVVRLVMHDAVMHIVSTSWHAVEVRDDGRS